MRSDDPFTPAPAPGGEASPMAGILARWQRYRFLLKRRWWVVLLTASIALGVQSWIIFSKAPSYLSSAQMLVSGYISLPGAAVFAEEASNFYGTQIVLMRSQAVRMAAEARIRALRPELTPSPVSLNVSQQKNASIFTLQAIGAEPAYTQAFLDACMQEYINTKKEMRSQKSETTVMAITESLKTLEKEIKGMERELIEFQRANNVNFLQAEGNSAGSYLSEIDRKLAALNTEYQLLNLLTLDQNLERRRDAAEKMPDGAFGPQSEYFKARQQIQLLKARLAEYSQDLRPKHPIIQQLNSEISMQEKLIGIYQEQSKSQLTEQRQSLKLQIENLENERKEWSTKALDLSGRAAEYETIKAKLDRSKALYDRLLTSMQAVDVNKNIDQDVVTVLENASSAIAVKPGVGRTLLLAAIVGLGAGLGLLFLIDQLDDRIITVAEFETHFHERVLGHIPEQSGPDIEPLQVDDDRHVFQESFSNIRSSLLFLPYDGPCPKTILITSAVPNEGKSTISANLARTLALGGARTLLIDGDLRRGDQHDLFKVDNAHGFSDVITGKLPWREVIKPTDIETLSLLTRGKAMTQPTKSLLGKAPEEFLKDVYSHFDFIIFDSCPVLAADDTTSLAPKIDATLLVVRLGASTVKESRNALKSLRARQVNVLGSVINSISGERDGYTYYTYSDYHLGETKA